MLVTCKQSSLGLRLLSAVSRWRAPKKREKLGDLLFIMRKSESIDLESDVFVEITLILRYLRVATASWKKIGVGIPLALQIK